MRLSVSSFRAEGRAWSRGGEGGEGDELGGFGAERSLTDSPSFPSYFDRFFPTLRTRSLARGSTIVIQCPKAAGRRASLCSTLLVVKPRRKVRPRPSPCLSSSLDSVLPGLRCQPGSSTARVLIISTSLSLFFLSFGLPAGILSPSPFSSPAQPPLLLTTTDAKTQYHFFPLHVSSLAETWLEAHERRREWVSYEEAMRRVGEWADLPAKEKKGKKGEGKGEEGKKERKRKMELQEGLEAWLAWRKSEGGKAM